MQANRSKYICLVRILKLWSGIFFKLSNYKVYYYNINRQMMGYLKKYKQLRFKYKICKWWFWRYIKWIKEQAGGFIDDDKLIHFMIVSADYVLDTVSKYEPDEYYLSKLTCSDSTKISLWHNLLCNFIDFSWYCLIPKFTQKAKAEWLKNIANKAIFQCLSQKISTRLLECFWRRWRDLNS